MWLLLNLVALGVGGPNGRRVLYNTVIILFVTTACFFNRATTCFFNRTIFSQKGRNVAHSWRCIFLLGARFVVELFLPSTYVNTTLLEVYIWACEFVQYHFLSLLCLKSLHLTSS